MKEVASLFIPLASPCGVHLVHQHDTHNLFSCHATYCVHRHDPHNDPCDTDSCVDSDLARGVRSDGLRDHHHVDSCVDYRAS